MSGESRVSMAANARPTYRIGELASRSGVTRDTLRFYERRRLLPVPRRTAGGFRIYPADVVDRLRFIKRAQMVGLTLHEIAALVTHRQDSGLRRCRQVRDLLRVKVADLDTKISELQAFRTTLAHYLDQCEGTIDSAGKERGGAAAHCPVIDTLTGSR